MTAEQIGIVVGVLTFAGTFGVCLVYHRRDQRARRRRAAVYELARLAKAAKAPAAPVTPTPSSVAPSDRSRMRTVPEAYRFARPKKPSLVSVPVSKPIPLGPTRATVAPLQRRTRVVAQRVSDDSDDDLWLRRSMDVAIEVAADVALPALESVQDPEPADVFEGGGGEFGGAGASGSWDAPDASTDASEDSTSSEPPSGGSEP